LFCPEKSFKEDLKIKRGTLRGRSPQAELGVRKAEGLIIGRVG